MELLPVDRQLCSTMSQACKILYVEGHNDFNHGQISARRLRSDLYWIRAAARGFDEIADDDFVLVDRQGTKLAGKGAVPPEWPIHSEVYRLRSDVGSIVHTHPPGAVAFSATGRPIRPVSHDGAFFATGVPIFSATTNTIIDTETAKLLATQLGDAKGALLKNHGIVTVGGTVRDAVIAALLLERAAQVELQLGSTPNVSGSPEKDIQDKNEFIFGSVAMKTYWDYFCRRSERAASGTQLRTGSPAPTEAIR
jgi:L-fuculose-phosphate aldolase